MQTEVWVRVRQTEFHQFLADFAEAIEQAAMGEPAEGLNSLLEAERRAVEAQSQDQTRLALEYRYQVAREVFASRYDLHG
jgi:hypothetical protein